MPKAPFNPRDLRSYFALSQIPFEVLLLIGVGLGVDYFFDSRPWGTVIGAFLGLVVGFTHMIALLVQLAKSASAEKQDGK